MINKKIIILISLLILIITIIFVVIKTANSGNNIISKNSDLIVNNILNMKSYDANVEITIISNKNENTYKMNQQNIGSKCYKQTIQEPAKIAGTEIIFEENKLEIRNTKLNLSKIYENYHYISENALLLSSFVADYAEENEIKQTEKDNQIILEIKIKNDQNQYTEYKSLYIDKTTGKPTKMEIKDIAQNVRVYILYNEIKINALQEIK